MDVMRFYDVSKSHILILKSLFLFSKCNLNTVYPLFLFFDINCLKYILVFVIKITKAQLLHIFMNYIH